MKLEATMKITTPSGRTTDAAGFGSIQQRAVDLMTRDFAWGFQMIFDRANRGMGFYAATTQHWNSDGFGWPELLPRTIARKRRGGYPVRKMRRSGDLEATMTGRRSGLRVEIGPQSSDVYLDDPIYGNFHTGDPFLLPERSPVPTEENLFRFGRFEQLYNTRIWPEAMRRAGA